MGGAWMESWRKGWRIRVEGWRNVAYGASMVLLALVADVWVWWSLFDNKGVRGAGLQCEGEVKLWLAWRWRTRPNMGRRFDYWLRRQCSAGPREGVLRSEGGLCCAICGMELDGWKVETALGGAKICTECDYELEAEVREWRKSKAG